MKKIDGLDIKKECERLTEKHPELITRYVTAISELNDTEVIEVSMILFREASPELMATLTVFMSKVSDKLGELISDAEDEELKAKVDRIGDLVDELTAEDLKEEFKELYEDEDV